MGVSSSGDSEPVKSDEGFFGDPFDSQDDVENFSYQRKSCLPLAPLWTSIHFVTSIQLPFLDLIRHCIEVFTTSIIGRHRLLWWVVRWLCCFCCFGFSLIRGRCWFCTWKFFSGKNFPVGRKHFTLFLVVVMKNKWKCCFIWSRIDLIHLCNGL